uniref:Ribosomal RNA processing protein 1 homolog A isoform X1 n=1 Tax=Sus scrofa TaxID=9823 RepID=A0A480HW72_PIG
MSLAPWGPLPLGLWLLAVGHGGSGPHPRLPPPAVGPSPASAPRLLLGHGRVGPRAPPPPLPPPRGSGARLWTRGLLRTSPCRVLPPGLRQASLHSHAPPSPRVPVGFFRDFVLREEAFCEVLQLADHFVEALPVQRRGVLVTGHLKQPVGHGLVVELEDAASMVVVVIVIVLHLLLAQDRFSRPDRAPRGLPRQHSPVLLLPLRRLLLLLLLLRLQLVHELLDGQRGLLHDGFKDASGDAVQNQGVLGPGGHPAERLDEPEVLVRCQLVGAHFGQLLQEDLEEVALDPVGGLAVGMQDLCGQQLQQPLGLPAGRNGTSSSRTHEGTVGAGGGFRSTWGALAGGGAARPPVHE